MSTGAQKQKSEMYGIGGTELLVENWLNCDVAIYDNMLIERKKISWFFDALNETIWELTGKSIWYRFLVCEKCSFCFLGVVLKLWKIWEFSCWAWKQKPQRELYDAIFVFPYTFSIFHGNHLVICCTQNISSHRFTFLIFVLERIFRDRTVSK